MAEYRCFLSGMKQSFVGLPYDYSLNGGNLVYVDLEFCSITLRLINIYAPNNELIEGNNLDHSIICGDFNMVLNPEKDCFNYVNINNPRSQSVLIETMSQLNLIDTF